MPNGAFHRAVGMAAGTGVAAYRYRTLPAAIAGGVGGNLGAALPDWLEPATNPNHRGLIHSWVTAGTVLCTLSKIVPPIEDYSAERVQFHEMQVLVDPNLAWWHRLLALLWSVVGAFVVGMYAGFGSHLAFDALTPRSLPLLINGF